MTDTTKDAVARMCLAMINSGNTTTANMLNALADERDRLATAHKQLMQSLDAANARADQARDDALVEAAGTLEVQALDTDAQAERFRGGSDPWADRTARSRALRNSAAAILALRVKPAPAVTVEGFPPNYCTSWEDCNHDGVCHDPDQCGATGPNARAIAGGGDE